MQGFTESDCQREKLFPRKSDDLGSGKAEEAAENPNTMDKPVVGLGEKKKIKTETKVK